MRLLSRSSKPQMGCCRSEKALSIRPCSGCWFQIEVAIAGVDPKEIDVEVTTEDILLTANTQHLHSEQKGVVHYCEFESGKMFRSIHLPKKINPDKVNAQFKDGL